MEVGGGYGAVVEDGCRTPVRGGCQIPAALVCPQAPRKKPMYRKQRNPPKNGYFHPPDLDTIFAMATRGEACA